MADFKNKLNYIISGQVPEFIRSTYPVFVSFLEAYYTFLDEDEQANNIIQNSDSWQNIDKTLDVFIPEFRKQYAHDFPSTAILDVRRLLKYISEYYEAKGSENGTELFFKFMYGDPATVSYPGDNILRASDGRWEQKRIIKLDSQAVTEQDPHDLLGKIITLEWLEFVPLKGDVRQTQSVECYNVVRQIEPTIWQLEVNLDSTYVWPDVISVDPTAKRVNGTVIASLGNFDTHVYVKLKNIIYGTITKQIVGVVNIDVPGALFRSGDMYVISEQGVDAPYFFSNYSPGYTSETFDNNAIVSVSRVGNSSIDEMQELSVIATGERFSARKLEAIPGSADWVVSDYVQGNDYAFDVQRLIPTTTFTIDIPPLDLAGVTATVTFQTGLIFKSHGVFKTPAGFISDTNSLQDNNFYQPYSYVVSSSKGFDVWKETFSKSTHPAGFKMFAELLLQEDVTHAGVSVSDTLTLL